jgi:hypothetical protein
MQIYIVSEIMGSIYYANDVISKDNLIPFEVNDPLL